LLTPYEKSMLWRLKDVIRDMSTHIEQENEEFENVLIDSTVFGGCMREIGYDLDYILEGGNND